MVRQAELDLSCTRIVAPEDGRVTRKSVEPGQYVQVGQLTTIFSARFGPYLGRRMALGTIFGQLQRQSALMAFVDNFQLFGSACLCCVPLVLLFRRVRHAPAPGAAH